MEAKASDSDSECHSRDWAHLPLPAVHLISQTIKSLTDYVRLRAVCSPWRRATPSRPHKPLPPQLPWLMLPYASHREWIDGTADDGTRLFYDLWESKFRSLHLPETIGKMCCACYLGWLLLVADHATELFLFNPTTRARVDLPSFATPVKHVMDDEGAKPRMKLDHLFRGDMTGSFAITKVTFSSDLADPGCVVMVFLEHFLAVFYCRVGDRCWTEVFKPFRPSEEPADAAYHNGIFYIIGTIGMHILDLSRPKVPGVCSFGDHLKGVEKFFLVGKSGLYVVAVRYSEEAEEVGDSGSSMMVPKHMVEMYRVTNTMVLERVTDTGDTTIFYGDRNHYLALCADDWDVLEGSSMYMQYRCAPAGAPFMARKKYSILFAKLEDAKPKPVLLNFGKEPKIWPPATAMWFQPSFD